MSNTSASDDNTESPSMYGKNAYKEYRNKEKKQEILDENEENQQTDSNYK
jgi:hypothetical protein